MDEQEIFDKYTPFVANLICEYFEADAARQIEIVSKLVKDCTIFQIDDGPFQRALHEMVGLGWMNRAGDILIDIELFRS